MKYTKEETADIARKATHDYFVEGKEQGLLKLIEIIQSMYIKKVSNYGIKKDLVDDSLQDLVVRILKTAKSYDVTKSTDTSSFVSYFYNQIKRQEQELFYRNNFPNLRCNATDIALHNMVRGKSEKQLLELIDSGKISKLRIDKIKSITGIGFQNMHNDNKDDDEYSLDTMLPDDSLEEHSDAVDAVKIIKMVDNEIEKLDENEKRSLVAYYFDGNTLDIIAQDENVSREAIRRRCISAVRKIRANLSFKVECEDISLDSFLKYHV